MTSLPNTPSQAALTSDPNTPRSTQWSSTPESSQGRSEQYDLNR